MWHISDLHTWQKGQSSHFEALSPRPPDQHLRRLQQKDPWVRLVHFEVPFSLPRPLIKDKDNNLFYFHKHNDLNLVAISKKNNNAILVFTFLHTLVAVLESYFKDVQEESIRDNFVVVYELLDEMMDNGYPQTTEIKLLKGFIKT